MLTVFLIAAAAQLFFWGLFSQFAFPAKKPEAPEEGDSFPPVSVVVCFRNEEDAIQNCLANILKQKYAGSFEVLAVDDNSTDKSAAIVQAMMAHEGGLLRLLQPGPTRPGKKDALTFGIQNTRHEHILLTDADCLASSERWLTTMTRPLRRGAEVVLGVGEYAPNNWQWVDRFQRFEAMYVALKYLTFAQLGLPYMGVGRNLAYQKSFFGRSDGFTDHADLPGGDDDLLVGNNAKGRSTVCVTSPKARTVSSLSGRWAVFIRQRMRHQSVGFRYRPVHQLGLGMIALSHGLFFLLGLFLLFTSYWKFALLIYAVRFLLVLFAFRKTGLLGAAAGAKEGFKKPSTSAWRLAFFDAMLAPWYLFLAVVGMLPARKW